MGLDIPKIRELEDQIPRLRRLFLDGVITSEELQEREAEVNKEIREAYGFPVPE